MARSEQQIEDSLRSSFEEINPSLDLKVGPTYDYTLRPIPRELAFVESEVERLLRFYSSDFPNVATPSEARDLATNFGISISAGERARGTVVFFRNSPPPSGTTAVVTVGSLVSTVDGQFLFRTSETKVMQGDYADTYFNPTTNKYEIEVLVQAIAPGSVYNLPAQRIRKVVAGQGVNFDGVVQNNPMAGGTEPENSVDLSRRVIQQFKGINLNSIAGVAALARRFVPTGIIDTRVIRPTDRLEFRRPTSRPSLDLCIKGAEFAVFEEEYFAIGGETQIKITNATVNSVSQVRLNDVVLDVSQWTYLPDTSPEYRGSTRARNYVQFLLPLTANDVVDIVGTRNSLLDRVQAVVQSTDDAIFKTDIMVRSFVVQPIVVGLELKIKNNPNISVQDVESDLINVVSTYIEPPIIPSVLSAEDLKAALRANIPEIDSIKIFEFRRRYSSIDTVEYIVPLKNEEPRYDSIASQLIVRS